jgi:lipopolysaccharide transport system ATP-binding protein
VIEFTAPRLTAPDSSIIGVIEEGPASLHSIGIVRLGPGDAIPEIPGNFIFDHALSRADAITKAKAVARILELRRAGATLALISHEESLLESCADEIWWVRGGELVARGDPAEVLAEYRRYVCEKLREAGEGQVAELAATMRTGDGRAVLEKVELVGESGVPSTIFRFGEEVAIRVVVRFADRVEDPVIGIMIRTRIGLNVYGTNTELEKLKLGPVEAGRVIFVTYRFVCALCPAEYTVTAASHDPDGRWHDWMEDAVGFTVCDSRYTAGVANLRARVDFSVE